MAIVGYFANLVEAQKYVQSKLLAGVVQEIIEEGQLLPMLPVFQISSKSILYNRETTPPSAAFYDIHEQIGWTAQATGDQKEVALKIVAEASILDRFMMETYKDPNDYRTLILSQLRKGCMRTMEDKLIYGDIDADAAEFDGIGHLFEEDASDGDDWTDANGSVQQFDEDGGAMSCMVLREMIDRVKPRPDILLMTRTSRNRLSAAQFEVGLAATYPQSVITITKNEFGGRTDYFDGVRIVVSDYLTDENTDSGDKSAASGLVSVFAMRFGQIMDGGLCLCIGGRTGGPEFFNMVEIPDMEDYDASGIRLTAYCALALGSSKALARIHGITAITAVVA